MADTQGFFFPDQTPDQMDLQRRLALADAIQKRGLAGTATGRFGGLANAGSALAGALAARSLGNQQKDLETQREGSYSKALGNALGPSDNSQWDASTPADASGVPGPVNVSPAVGAPLAQRIAATGNPDLQRQLAPQLLAQAIQRSVPNIHVGPTGVAYDENQLQPGQQVYADPRIKPQEAINQEIALKGAPGPAPQPSVGMTPDAEAQALRIKQAEDAMAQKDAIALKQTPGALTPGDSPLAFQQKQDLEKLKAETQSGTDSQIESQAQAIAKYQQPLPPGGRNNPYNRAVNERVMQLNPQYNSQNYTKSQQAYKDFGSGKLGSMTRSANVAIAHLSTLDKLNDALGNGDVQAINSLSNTFKEQFGSAAPTNFNAAKAIVGDELVKFITGTGGALADRENAQNQINSAKSPAQLKGVIKTYKDLMTGQLGGLKRQYEQSTMRNDFESLLSPETQGEIGGAPPSPISDPQAIVDELRKRGVIK